MGFPHVHNRIYEFLKQHPGEQFSTSAIREALGLQGAGGTSTTFRLVKRNHPAVISIVPISKKLFTIRYDPVKPKQTDKAFPLLGGALPERKPESGTAFEPNRAKISVALEVRAARDLYEQLHAVFGK